MSKLNESAIEALVFQEAYQSVPKVTIQLLVIEDSLHNYL
jgi:hypothetical protein